MKIQLKFFFFVLINVLIITTLLNLFYYKRIHIGSVPNSLARALFGPAGPNKYVIYECNGKELCGGLVDRFKAVIDAYAWAQFTKRHLIISISQPCNFVNLMVPNGNVNWSLTLEDLVKSGDLPVAYARQEVRHLDDFGFKNELASMDILNYYNETDVISLYTNLEWISAYAKNGYLNKSIEEIGFKHDEFHFSTAFNRWFNGLFKLHPVVQRKFDVYLNKLKPTSTTKSICIQVRIGGARPNVGYDRDITPRNFSTYYWDFVKDRFIKQLKDDYRIFVTADTESVEKEAQEAFGQEKTVVIDGISAHVDRESGFKDNCTRFEKIIMDFYMLGNCDMALVSDSGFGIFGILRNRIPDENYYVLTALSSGLKKPEFFFIKDFIYANPHRY